MSAATHRAYLGLGGNLGDRHKTLDFALDALASLSQTSLQAISSRYETEPWGVTEQPAFLNMCVSLATGLTPHALLEDCQAIELKAGRQRRERWGPRTLDIDILLYDDLEISDDTLKIPHPGILDRAFVLKPLVEIAPSLKVGGISAAAALVRLGDGGIVRVERHH